MFRRFTTTARFRRTSSEVELIAIASTSRVATVAARSRGVSTNLLAAVTRAFGTRFSTKAVPFSKRPILPLPFDDFNLDTFKSFSQRVRLRSFLRRSLRPDWPPGEVHLDIAIKAKDLDGQTRKPMTNEY